MATSFPLPYDDLRTAARVVRAAVDLIHADPATADPTQNTGGYLCSRDDDGTVFSVLRFGQITGQDAKDCMGFALEKTARLFERSGDISSWQTRDTDANPPLYGGGIATFRSFISFSGFPEDWDEAVVLAIALKERMITENEAAAIVAVSGNTRLPILLTALETPAVD